MGSHSAGYMVWSICPISRPFLLPHVWMVGGGVRGRRYVYSIPLQKTVCTVCLISVCHCNLNCNVVWHCTADSTLHYLSALLFGLLVCTVIWSSCLHCLSSQLVCTLCLHAPVSRATGLQCGYALLVITTYLHRIPSIWV